ncbi:hypothetical protein [Haloarchaeobius amylolyticus]|uniref:hypothetical protein n=1 Tax=Haloarchaeobius amylolyticus TaxID=1198296 RepID=UPI002271A421|nr:hypothetical protein [Haloarchaeobius amylolyticus]
MSESRAGRRTLTVAVVAFVIAVISTLVFVRVVRRLPLGSNPEIALQLLVKTFVSTFTVVLLVALTANYLTVYRELPNRFTLSLIIFCLSLLLYAITSVPLVAIVFGGFRQGLAASIGPFAFIPDVFASIAVLILLHQSYE